MNKPSWYGKSGFISLMLAGLCLLSGCSVGVGFGVGPVGLYFGVYADPDVTSPEAKRFICDLQQSLQKQGYQVTALKDEHLIGFTAKRRLDPDEINQADSLPHILDQVSLQLVPEGRRFRVKTVLDLKALETADAHADSSIHYNLKLGFLRPPIASNADQVENQGKELEWSFQAARAKSIEVDFAS
ncbi:MAG TPA: hypothetical protein V6C52_05160 [Coleofasciculaceae cyanobacterium]|jgi:hypothetical protein